jgi:hypothetical protein
MTHFYNHNENYLYNDGVRLPSAGLMSPISCRGFYRGKNDEFTRIQVLTTRVSKYSDDILLELLKIQQHILLSRYDILCKDTINKLCLSVVCMEIECVMRGLPHKDYFTLHNEYYKIYEDEDDKDEDDKDDKD